MIKKKICVVTGSRSEFGLMANLLREIKKSKKLKGPDHTSSLEPQELNTMVKSIRNIENALGRDKKIVTRSEGINKRHVRKSIVALNEIDKGEIFSEKNITLKRPGTGLQPIHWHKIIGKKSKRNYKIDDFIND